MGKMVINKFYGGSQKNFQWKNDQKQILGGVAEEFLMEN